MSLHDRSKIFAIICHFIWSIFFENRKHFSTATSNSKIIINFLWSKHRVQTIGWNFATNNITHNILTKRSTIPTKILRNLKYIPCHFWSNNIFFNIFQNRFFKNLTKKTRITFHNPMISNIIIKHFEIFMWLSWCQLTFKYHRDLFLKITKYKVIL